MKDGKYVILCIDDDPDLLFSLRVVLEANGYLVFAVASAEEGIKAYKENNPDVLIVDLMMEEIDAGMRVVQELHALGNKAPLYLLSSTGDYLYGMVDLHDQGVTAIFQKPLSPDTLLSLLKARLP